MKTHPCMLFLNRIGLLIGIGGLPGANAAANRPSPSPMVSHQKAGEGIQIIGESKELGMIRIASL